ncbi:DUF2514 family protein [Pseudomonas putida]|uniref:DUF2514 family protein n=1 Tax=Pseudomonas putida TaxID=303 RepID=UPI0009825D48
MAINQLVNDARQQQAIASADGVGVDAAGEWVRFQAGKVGTSASCAAGNSAAIERSKAATRAPMDL